MTIRVAFFGNVANSLLRLVRSLQGVDGIEAVLFVDRRDSSRPDLEAVSADDTAWIRHGSFLTGLSSAAPWTSPIVKELKGFDVAVVSGFGPMYAQFAGIPWVFSVTGADLTLKPFPIRHWTWHRHLWRRVLALPVGAWQRRAIRRAPVIWSQPFDPFTLALRRLGVSPEVSEGWPVRLVIDTDTFSERSVPPPAAVTAAVERMRRSSLTVFHPSRIVLDGPTVLWETGQVKRNDVLIRGFARFVRDTASADALLVMPASEQSRDAERARALVIAEGIDDQVLWLDVGRPLDQSEMVALYSAADVVADDFGAGWFGFVALEGMAMSRPVVSFVDGEAMAKMYPWHPIQRADTETAVAASLGALSADPDLRRRIGEDGRRWIEEFHAPDAVRSRYVEAIRAAVERSASGNGSRVR